MNMWKLIEAMWMAAGAASVAGTLWLMVASRLGIWPFGERKIRARLSPGEFWLDTPAGKVHGFGGFEEYSRFMLAYTAANGTPDQWFEGNE